MNKRIMAALLAAAIALTVGGCGIIRSGVGYVFGKASSAIEEKLYNSSDDGITKKHTKVYGDHKLYTAEGDAFRSYRLVVEDIFFEDTDCDIIIRPATDKARVEVDASSGFDGYGLKAAIDGKTITVSCDPSLRFESDSFTITVYAACEDIYIAGGYDIDADMSGVGSLSLVIDGAANGNIYGLTASSVDLEVNGAGEIDLQGKTEALTCTVNGAGSIDADELTAMKVKATLNGAGEISVNATDKLVAAVNGIGNIEYSGDPSVEKSINGLGSVKKKD